VKMTTIMMVVTTIMVVMMTSVKSHEIEDKDMMKWRLRVFKWNMKLNRTN